MEAMETTRGTDESVSNGDLCRRAERSRREASRQQAQRAERSNRGSGNKEARSSCEVAVEKAMEIERR